MRTPDMVFDRSTVGSVLAWIGGYAIVVTVFDIALVYGAKSWLREEPRLVHVNVTVVPGGESGQRVIGAAEPYHIGTTLRVFAGGRSDYLLIERRLVMAGASVERVGHKCVLSSTMESTRMMRETLAGQQVQSTIPVTSWYHTGWVLVVFRKAWPEITQGTQGVLPDGTLAKSVPVYEAGSILAKYIKRV